MLTFTAPITVPNVNRCEVVAVTVKGKQSIAYVYVDVIGVGGPVYGAGPKELVVTNGSCTGLRATAAPTAFDDRVETFAKPLPTGFTDLMTQYRTGGEAAGRRAVETWMASAPVGLLPPGSVA